MFSEKQTDMNDLNKQLDSAFPLLYNVTKPFGSWWSASTPGSIFDTEYQGKQHESSSKVA